MIEISLSFELEDLNFPSKISSEQLSPSRFTISQILKIRSPHKESNLTNTCQTSLPFDRCLCIYPLYFISWDLKWRRICSLQAAFFSFAEGEYNNNKENISPSSSSAEFALHFPRERKALQDITSFATSNVSIHTHPSLLCFCILLTL